MAENIQFALNSLTDLQEITRNLASIDVNDISRSSRIISEVSRVFEKIPIEAKGLKQYTPVIAIFKTKSALLKAEIQNLFRNAYVVSSSRIQTDFSYISCSTLWSSASSLGLESSMIGDLVERVNQSICRELLGSRAVQSMSASEDTWVFTRSESQVVSLESIGDAIAGLFKFMHSQMPEDRIRHELSRRLWLSLSKQLSKQFGPKKELASLEEGLIAAQLLPSTTNTKLKDEWEERERESSRSVLNEALADVRARLQSDVNRKTMKLTIPKSSQLKNAIVPNYASIEIVRIVNNYISRNSHETIPSIISLFTVLRQPELVDPHSTSARNCGIFFNDCVFLCLALALAEGQYIEQIIQLREAAGRAVSHFLKNVSARAVKQLSGIAGGLVDVNQVAIAEQAVTDCLTEVSECLTEWERLEIDAPVLSVWTGMIIDPILKEMIKVCVSNARTAIGTGRGILSSGSAVVNSGVWSLFRRFAAAVENTATNAKLTELVAWNVSQRAKLALCGSRPEIMELEALPPDEYLYGINQNGFEALLLCNPLMQGESKETIKSLSSRFMSGTQDEPMAPQRDFASLFNRN